MTFEDFDDASLGDIGPAFAEVGRTMDGITAASQRFGRAISEALRGAIVEGRKADDVFKTLGQRMVRIGADIAFRMVAQDIGTLVRGAFDPAALANAATPFARGGIVGAPTFFSGDGGLGLMGEAGAEAILPLARGPDGRLGVRSQNDFAAPVNVTVNVTTPDAASFRRSEAYLSGVVARAVERGRRTL